jgi:hypothetical protein
MNHSLTIEIVDKDAVIFLQGMEQMNLIKIFKKSSVESPNWIKKYKGAMSPQPIEEIDRQLNELRNAWE